MTLVLITLGALVGAPARYLTDRGFQARFGSRWPWGTLTVNVVASFVLGVVLGAGTHVDRQLLALIGTGFCGALSTYSTFSFETLRLYERGSRRSAISYVALSLIVGIGAAGAGWALGSTLS
jgi:CrcB protein